MTTLATVRPLATTRRDAAIARLDWVLVVAVGLILVLGTLLVWSATSTGSGAAGGADPRFLQRHLLNIGIGLVLGVAVMVTDHRYLRIVTPIVYGAAVIGLLLVLAFGSTVNGSRSWLMVGGMSIQPGEFAKPAVVVAIALVLAERLESSRRRSVGMVEVFLMLVIAGIPAGLILLQPDLGTMLVLALTVLGVVAISGVSRGWLAALSGGGVVVAVGVVVGGLLKPYQLHRFMAFTDPSLDPRGAGYNTTQARIAIGNGGVFGQGLFNGSQTRSGFVPEQHTDFVFTVAGEELGLVGAGVLILLLLIVLIRAVAISRRSGDVFGRVAAAGIACWLGFQAFWNIGMCLGIMPVTGVPLPLVSYGGSSMFATLMAVGLLLNLDQRARTGPRQVSAAAPIRVAAPVRVAGSAR